MPSSRQLSRIRRRLTGVAALALLLTAPALRDAVAEDPPAADDFERTPLEDEVWKLYFDGKLITARRKCEQLLKQDPDSIVGHYVMGNVLRQSEGALPEAMKHLGRAREIYEGRFTPGETGAGGAPVQLHRELLYSIQALAGELEKLDYQLQILDFYDSLYSPRLTGEHAWPLMKLGRFDEAREKAKKAMESRDPYQRSLGLNAMCAIEGEAGERVAYYEACRAAFDGAVAEAKLDPPDASPEVRTPVTVHAYNAALAAAAVQRLDEVERLAKEGTLHNDFTVANPWRVLLLLYTSQGRTEEAVQALREMHTWRKRQPPYLRDQVRAETDASYALFLLVAGEPERGLRAITRSLEYPDRQGLRSGGADQALGGHALLRRALATTMYEVQRERASYTGGFEAWSLQRRSWDSSGQRWADAERTANVLSDEKLLLGTLRMASADSLSEVPPWLVADRIEVAGPGVVYDALEKVREREKQTAEKDGLVFEPYHDAIEAEIHLAWGDAAKARELAEKAMSTLGPTDVLMRARAAAVAARACQSLGDRSAMIAHLAMAMELDGSIVRRMSLRIPARIEVEGSGEAALRLEALLGRSPRLSVSSSNGDGFVVQIREVSGAREGVVDLQACLVDPSGSERFCVSSAPVQDPHNGGQNGPSGGPALETMAEDNEPPPTALEIAGLAAEAFHHRAFAMPVVISNVDLASLDGTATISSEVGRERVQNALDRALGEIDEE